MLATAILHLISLVLPLLHVDSRAAIRYASGDNKNFDEAVEFLWANDKLNAEMSNKVQLANWNYEADLTDENKEKMLEIGLEAAKLTKETWKNATSFAWKDFKERSETVYRWFRSLASLGNAALSDERLNMFNNIIADMSDTYAKAKVCGKGSPKDKPCELSLDPEITEILRNSRDYDELKQIWVEWHDAIGKKVKSEYLDYVKISNEIADLNGYKDAGEMWRNGYEEDNFQEVLESLWEQVEPFYKQIHAFVRKRLIKRYPDRGILPDGPIPAHLLGNMWAQTWDNIFPDVKPFPKSEFIDVSENMVKMNMTPIQMFRISEDFFTSIGLKPMTDEFWNRSIIEKQKDKDMICHASAWDFSDGKDFRIKMCTVVNMDNLLTVHHEMGHVQYYLQYAHQPTVFRDGANSGFHEAVGDVLSLSVGTSEHLKKIKLMDDREENEESKINSLMEKALEKIPFVPFAYLTDFWRWKVFSGEFSEKELNSKWWEQRLKYQGICPPVKRTDDDLDAASKYHVVADVPYVRYFVSTIIQFQFHKALCEVAGHKGPLHECDIYKNKDAGKLFGEVLSYGSSIPWKDAMGIITKNQTKEMDAGALLEYFDPLIQWLKKENEDEKIGWKSTDPMICPENLS